MSTAECIETISQEWWLAKQLTGNDSSDPKDWKRVSKRKGLDGESWVRTFEYKPNGAQVVMVTDSDDDPEDNYEIIDAGDWLYSLQKLDGEHVLCFNPEAYWNREKALYDQHVSSLVHALTGFDVDDFEGDEVCENQIVIPDERVEFVKAALVASGMRQSAEMDAFLMSCWGE